MIDQERYLSEMLDGVRRAFSVMRHEYPDVEIYTVSIWTDAKANKSAVSFDTFDNSKVQCAAQNAIWKKWRDRWTAEGNAKRLSLVPPDEVRNTEPAVFKFRNVVLFDNDSLAKADFADAQEWTILERLLKQIQESAVKEAKNLKLHPDAELGINGPKT